MRGLVGGTGYVREVSGEGMFYIEYMGGEGDNGDNAIEGAIKRETKKFIN